MQPIRPEQSPESVAKASAEAVSNVIESLWVTFFTCLLVVLRTDVFPAPQTAWWESMVIMTLVLAVGLMFGKNILTLIHVQETLHGGSQKALHEAVRYHRKAHPPLIGEGSVTWADLSRECRSLLDFVSSGVRDGLWQLPVGARGTVEFDVPSDPGVPPQEREARIALAIKNGREAARKTQEHVAAEAGVCVKTVRRAERTGKVSFENLRALCAALDIRMESHAFTPSDMGHSAPAWARLAKRVFASSNEIREEPPRFGWVRAFCAVSIFVELGARFLVFADREPECAGPGSDICQILASDLNAEFHGLSQTFLAFAAVQMTLLLLPYITCRLRSHARMILRLSVGVASAACLACVIGSAAADDHSRTLRTAAVMKAASVADRAAMAAHPGDRRAVELARSTYRTPILEGYLQDLKGPITPSR